MKTVGIIPVRLESSRLPRKALEKISGLTLIQHVYRRSLLARSLDEVIVATDSLEVASIIGREGGKVEMTSSTHQTGTDRIAEVAMKIEADTIVNIQGDEALLDPVHIDKVVEEFQKDKDSVCAVLVFPFNKSNSPSDIKAVVNERNHIMYFSRSDIPSDHRVSETGMLKVYHIVPINRQFLLEYSSWPPGRLEQIEFNEYLRILEKGFKILAVPVDSGFPSVDTKEDLEIVKRAMKSDAYFLRGYQC